MIANAEFEAAALLLRATPIRARLASFVRDSGAILWDGVRETARTFSDGELMLVEAAWALWGGRSTSLLDPSSPPPPLLEMMGRLDMEHRGLLCHAIEIRAGIGPDAVR